MEKYDTSPGKMSKPPDTHKCLCIIRCNPYLASAYNSQLSGVNTIREGLLHYKGKYFLQERKVITGPEPISFTLLDMNDGILRAVCWTRDIDIYVLNLFKFDIDSQTEWGVRHRILVAEKGVHVIPIRVHILNNTHVAVLFADRQVQYSWYLSIVKMDESESWSITDNFHILGYMGDTISFVRATSSSDAVYVIMKDVTWTNMVKGDLTIHMCGLCVVKVLPDGTTSMAEVGFTGEELVTLTVPDVKSLTLGFIDKRIQMAWVEGKRIIYCELDDVIDKSKEWVTLNT